MSCKHYNNYYGNCCPPSPCNDCDSLYCQPRPPPTTCKMECIKHRCKCCGRKENIKLQYEVPCPPPPVPRSFPVYAVAAITSNQSFSENNYSTVIFNSVISSSQVPDRCFGSTSVYNAATGTFTVPPCGKGIYNILTHITVSSGDSTIEIRVNGSEILRSAIGAHGTVGMNYLLYPGQTVTVAVAGDGGSATLTNPSTSLSIVKVSDVC